MAVGGRVVCRGTGVVRCAGRVGHGDLETARCVHLGGSVVVRGGGCAQVCQSLSVAHTLSDHDGDGGGECVGL